ncbi:glycosyltransferase [Pseudonocardia tropica]|uniref:glycosyltransferase n=1 Tax=Pseudonocardia tropica TaxID=681289 RepID=UPI0031EFFF6E
MVDGVTRDRTRVLLTFAFETLDDVRRREFCRPPDQLLLQVIADGRTESVTVADPWRSRIADVARGRWSRTERRVVIGGSPLTHVRPLRLRRTDPTDLASVRDQYQRYGRLLRRRCTPQDVLVTANPFVAAWAAPMLGIRCFYYARDDWAGHTFFRRWWPVLDAAQGEVGAGTAEIVAVSETLGHRLRPDGPVTVLPNGVAGHVWRKRLGWPTRLGPHPGVYALYSGSIGPRLDTELLARVVGHPALDAVLIAGPVESPALRTKLAALPRVRVLGDLDQATLAAVTFNAAVGVVPHVVNRQTTASSPLKVFEYLAAGLPVVTTDLQSIEDLGERVQPCGGPAEWVSALHRAIDAGAASEAERSETLAELDWTKRLRPLVDAVVQPVPRPLSEPR